MNVTDDQLGILRAIYDLGGHKSEFHVFYTHSGDSLSCGGSVIPIAADRADFRQLERENLIIIRDQDANSIFGKMTKRGIDAVEASFATSDHTSGTLGGIGSEPVAHAPDDESETANTSSRAPQDPVAAVRKALLQAYKDEGLAKGIRITDEMVAKAASPTWHDRTSVQRWKSNDSRCTAADDAKIRAVLRTKPHLK